MKDYVVIVEVGYAGHTFEVEVEVEAYDENDARERAEEEVRDNLYVIAKDAEEN